MGNKKLRREASKALKSIGYGRLYSSGGKRKAFRYLKAHTLRRIIFMANLRKGDIVNDCDGFNHRLEENPKVFRDWLGLPDFHQLAFDDGGRSCGCPYGPDEPWTTEQICQFHNVSDEYIEDQKKAGWWSEKSQALIDKIRSGKPITDTNGIKLETE